jgi:hypothetical protein
LHSGIVGDTNDRPLAVTRSWRRAGVPSVVAQIMSELDILLDGASNQIAEYESYKYEGY